MKTILKSLIVGLDEERWGIYRTQFKDFFKERDPKFDETVKFIDDFHVQFKVFPSWDVIYAELGNSNETELQSYLTAIIQDETAYVLTDKAQFSSYLQQTEASLTHDSLIKVGRQLTNEASTTKRTTNEMLAILEKTQQSLTVIRNRTIRSQLSTSTVLSGAAGNNLIDIYAKNEAQRHAGISNSFNLEFPELPDIEVKPGDLIVIGGFTSHGKSIWLRYLTYYFAITYGLNWIFQTFEMSHDPVRTLFSLLHANNKKIFPNTPYIEQNKFKKGLLTAEERDFLFNYAEPDLLNNPNYGIIYIDQPNSPRYRLRDAAAFIRETEVSKFPVHGHASDYLTLMYPTESDRAQPQTSDYNQMFKDYKNLALSHRNAQGQPSPLIAMTVAQISRQKFEEAQKNEGQYDLTAFSHYSEIERSSDIAFTCYAPPEFRAISKNRLQDLKNRDGAVNGKPLDVHCSYSQGFAIGGLRTMSEADTVSALHSLNL